METHHRQLKSMGTRLDIVFTGISDLRCEEVMEAITYEVMRIESKLSFFRLDSAISLINKAAHSGPVPLDEELRSIFMEIQKYHLESSGYFDITMKPLQDFLSKNDARGDHIPDHILNVTGMQHLMIGEQGIQFRHQGMKIDLGGFGKGYAVQKMVSILKSFEIENALISFGESLIFGLGSHPFGEVWQVKLPVSNGSNPIQFDLKNEALSTSGNSLNNQIKFAYSGHIVNPVTRSMSSDIGIVSVKSKDPLKAEIYSTVFFSAGKEMSKEIQMGISDLELIWITPSDQQF